MKYPTWQNFEAKYSDDPQAAFESLCRLLFRKKYGIVETLPYFYNNAGNEAVPIKQGKDEIGFQAKYFVGATINDSQAGQIKHSIERAHAHYPTQNKIIVYSNLLFGNPPEGKEKTARQKGVEDTARNNSMDVEWVCGANILDIVATDELIYNLFFNPDVDLIHQDESIKSANCIYEKSIKDTIVVKGKELTIERKDVGCQLEGYLSENKSIVLQGESGCGKSAVIKAYCANHTEMSVIWLNAGQFDTGDVNSLFHLDKSFTLGQVRQYYKKFKRKLIVIDSAEKLLDIQNRMPLMLFVGGMMQDDWQFVFTVRKSGMERLSRLLTETLGLATEAVEVPALTDNVLDTFLKNNSIVKPTDDRLYGLIHNLFYLARYVEVAKEGQLSVEDFRDKVWKIKIRGIDYNDFAKQEIREQCLLALAKWGLSNDCFYFKTNDLNLDAVGSLLQDDIVFHDSIRGYCFAHDIYQEWAMDYYVDNIWSDYSNVCDFLARIGDGQSSLNTFRRWYARAIDKNAECVEQFTDALFSCNLAEKWQNAIIAEVLRSKTYAKNFFDKYTEKLQTNNFQMAVKILKVLPVYGKDIQAFVTYNGVQYPIMMPTGSGWDCCVGFIYDHYTDIAPQNRKAINIILTDYPRIKNGDKQMLYKAGLLTLKPHNDAADLRQNGEHCFFENVDKTCKLTSKYFLYINREMQKIMQEAVENKWVKHTDPYYELSSFIVKADDDSGMPLYAFYPKEILSLMDLFWCGQDGDDENESWSNRHHHFDAEKAWGLNDNWLMLKYFPASAMQTCIGRMLVVHPQTTIDFILKFVDKCANAYAKNVGDNDATESFDLILPDGTAVMKFGNQTLWNMYRGTARMSVPNLLESIHMALERYLLQMVKEDNIKDVRMFLWTIINQSQSLSLMSIVASVVVAYPDKFFDEAILMTSNLHFLKYDLTRYSCEISSGMIDFAYHRHPNMLTERKIANAMKHRKQHLETLLFNIQVTYLNATDEGGKERLKRAYMNVDLLKKQLKDEPEDIKPLTKFIISRCDVRAMKKEEVDVNGTKGILFTPYLDEEQKAMNKVSARDSNSMLTGSRLRMWASYRAKGDFKKIKDYEYEHCPAKAIDVCKDILNQIEKRDGDLLLLPGDEYVPAIACSVLIRDFSSQLSEEDSKFCIDVVVNALENVNQMIGDGISGYATCLQAVGIIMEQNPEYKERCLHILYNYVSITQETAGRRACDVVSTIISDQKLWDKYEIDMSSLVADFINGKTESGDVNSLRYEDAESLLCLFAVYPKSDRLRHIADVCLERVSHIWDMNDKRKNLYLGSRHSSSSVVARIILSADNEDIPRLLELFTRYLNTDVHDTFLMAFVLQTVMTSDYSRFWIAWYALYDTIVRQRDNHFYCEMLSNYMLNPVQYTHWGDDWFRIEENDMAFFKKIANDLGNLPIVLKNIASVGKTLAKNYFPQLLDIFNDIAANHSDMDMGDMNDGTMMNMEAIMRRELPSLSEKIRTNEMLRKQLLTVLNFMKTHGSSYASAIVTGLI